MQFHFFPSLVVKIEVFYYVKGDVQGSMVEFDKTIDLDPRQKACKPLEIELY